MSAMIPKLVKIAELTPITIILAFLVLLASSRMGLGDSRIFPQSQDIVVLLDQIQDQDLDVRKAASRQLIRRLSDLESFDAKAVPILARALSDSDESLRGRAAAILAAISIRKYLTTTMKPAEDALLASLSDEDVDVRLNSLIALGSLRPPSKRAISAFLKLTTDPDWRVRTQAFTALQSATSEDKEVQDHLFSYLTAANPTNRMLALRAFAGMQTISTDVIEESAKLLRDQDNNVRFVAIDTLDRHVNTALASTAAVSGLRGVLQNPDETIDLRVRVTSPLAKMLAQKPEITDDFIKLLADKSVAARLRIAAANSLAYSTESKEKAITALRAAVHDEDATVRQQAEFALQHFSP